MNQATNLYTGQLQAQGTLQSNDNQDYAIMSTLSNVSVTGSSTTPILLAKAVNGRNITYNTSTGLATVTSNGLYLVSALFSMSMNVAASTGTLFVIVNGATTPIDTSYTSTSQFRGTHPFFLTANTTVGLGYNNTTTADANTHWSIVKVK